MSGRLDIDDVERFWNGQLAQTKAHPEREYLLMLIRPDEARDVLRLLAHIRELEAQAERDAKVVEAAVAYREAERKVAEAGYAPMSIGDRLIRGDIREALDAALAAREVRDERLCG